MLKHLASGGMADVMLGRSDGIEGFERHVVLKRIRPELAGDQRFVRMFLDEARVAATLHHQHIVQVHDICESAGEYFIAMEYVHGEDVRKILSNAARQRTHVPLGYAVAIVSAAAAGLHYAHERHGADKQPLNIVHRDVSPSNILVGYDGSIKVVDFGVATASMHQETRSGSLKGKLSYMSPEQCRGLTVDRRCDVYALGVVLYELATTTRMIKGENDYLVMEQIVHGRIAPPQSRRPGLPAELIEIMMRALATDRDHRYASAEELRVALDQFAAAAALTVSTSAIASYMRQQFGQRPEPWLELDGKVAGASEDVPTGPIAIDESRPSSSNSWTEAPRSDDVRSSSSAPLQSGPLARLAADMAPEPTVRNGPPQPAIATRPSGAPRDARPGWGSQHPPGPRRLAPNALPRAAMIGGAVAIAGIAVWFVVARTATPATRLATPAVAALPVTAPVARPVVTPLPAEPPPPAPAAAAPPAAPPVSPAVTTRPTPGRSEVAVREPDPTPVRKARSAATTAAARAASRVPEPPASKADRATRVAVVASPDPAAHGSDPGADADLHRAAAALPAPPPPPPPAPSATPPAVAVAVAAPPPAPPQPVAPQVIPPGALDANRISGDRSIVPDEATQGAISRAGADKLVSSYKLCITAEGGINTVTLLKSTGFPAYDDKIQSTIRRDWRFRPFLINGKAAPVCTAVRFLYSQK